MRQSFLRKKTAADGILAALLLIGTLSCGGSGKRTFVNPVLPGFYPDPSICRVGDDYYMVNSSFEYFPGVPVSHSRDLVNWRLVGYCLTRPSQLPLAKVPASGGIYAPTIRYHEGLFYMVTTNVSAGGNFYVTAKDPAGPWSEPVWLDKEGMDPSLLFDDDGTVYYTRHVGGGDGYIGQTTLDLASGKLKGELKNVWAGTGGQWAEGPHLYKVNGRYYLLISEGGTSYDHCLTVASADSPWGPFTSDPSNPILTHRDLPDDSLQALGHADWVETPDGWWLVCLGIRPQGGRFHHMGRETFLAPFRFDDNGWPVVNGNGRLRTVMPAPELPEHVWPKPEVRDDFIGDGLALEWNYLRNPAEADYSLTERPGFLRLWGSGVKLTDRDSPTFVGRRQTDFNCRVSTLLDFNPEREGDEAGLVVRQTDKYHFETGLVLKKGKRTAFLRRVIDGGVSGPVVTEEIPEGPVTLTVEATPLSYRFSVTPASGSPVRLGEALTRDLSVERIGFKDGMCFTGAYFGLYATGNGRRASAPADFDWMEIQPAQ
ncbi:MAG: glycoside hydrolase family 43 protein [bacterium]|nr:glycoside hydrolase family 43 protein [bacterium]